MELNEEEILEILKIVDESDLDELQLETDNLKLVLKKRGGGSTAQEMRGMSPQHVPMDSERPIASEGKIPSEEPDRHHPVTPAPAFPEDGLTPVKAPVLGIFYRSPGPGSPPFVEEGAAVGENDTVCIIEVMKVFSSVPAGVRGVVVRVCANNGETVEYGQTLFQIRPDGEHEGK